MKRFIIGIAILALAVLTGCSRTVTQMPTFGSELYVEFTLGDTADVVNNRYFVIFSTMESYRIPLPPPDSLDEFLEPGDEPQPGTSTKADYFNNYYSTWAGYVVVDSLGYSFAKGPFSINTPISKEVLSGIGNPSNKLSFNIRLDKIFGSTLPNQIYFDIISASYPASSLKVLKDRISPPTVYFEPIKGTIIQRTDADTTVVAEPNLDIINWKVSLP